MAATRPSVFGIRVVHIILLKNCYRDILPKLFIEIYRSWRLCKLVSRDKFENTNKYKTTAKPDVL